MTSLKFFQFLVILEDLYLISFLLHFLFHHTLKCLVILIFFENLYWIASETLAYSWTIALRDSLLDIFEIPILLIIMFMSSETNLFSSSLFFIITHLLSWINSSLIDMSTVKRAWSDRLLDFRSIKWTLILFYSCWRNIKSITELASYRLLAYWVKTWLIGNKSFKSKESVTSNKMSLKAEWWGYEGSYLLFLILKSSVITRILQIQS